MKKWLRIHWLALGTLGALALSACAVDTDESAPLETSDIVAEQAIDPAAGDVKVELSAASSVVAAEEGVLLHLTFTNVSAHPVRIIGYLAPDGELEEDMFDVRRGTDGSEFIGPHYKRPAPVSEDFVVLGPGKSLSRTADLNGFYDLTQTGDYSVRYMVEVKPTGAAGQAVKIASNDVSLWIEGRANPVHGSSAAAPSGGEIQGVTSSVTFNKCTVAQQDTVLQGLDAAATMATGAANYLGQNPSATPRYTTWFGTYSSGGWNTAKSHFTNIKSTLDTQTMSFDCGCKKRYYAYVYPNQPYNIYLCSVFWNAPLTGTDSKGGTIIHETSHFTVVAGTDDYAYGQTNAKALANSDPSKALFNADSHEYFAENTPALQ